MSEQKYRGCAELALEPIQLTVEQADMLSDILKKQMSRPRIKLRSADVTQAPNLKKIEEFNAQRVKPLLKRVFSVWRQAMEQR